MFTKESSTISAAAAPSDDARNRVIKEVLVEHFGEKSIKMDAKHIHINVGDKKVLVHLPLPKVSYL